MEYQFMLQANHKPIATLDMESEAFSRWFSEQLSHCHHKIVDLLADIDKVQQRRLVEYRAKGAGMMGAPINQLL